MHILVQDASEERRQLTASGATIEITDARTTACRRVCRSHASRRSPRCRSSPSCGCRATTCIESARSPRRATRFCGRTRPPAGLARRRRHSRGRRVRRSHRRVRRRLHVVQRRGGWADRDRRSAGGDRHAQRARRPHGVNRRDRRAIVSGGRRPRRSAAGDARLRVCRRRGGRHGDTRDRPRPGAGCAARVRQRRHRHGSGVQPGGQGQRRAR